MKRFINLILAVGFVGGFTFLVVNLALQHGTKWKFGTLLAPEPIIVDFRYADGEVVDPVTYYLHEQGLTQFFWWAMLAFAVFMFRESMLMARARRLREEENARLRRELGLPPRQS